MPHPRRAPLPTSPLLLPLLAFGQFISAIDYNIVYVALPDIGRELGFTVQSLQWVVSAYAVAFGGLLLLGGRAADLLGRRRMFTLALAAYGLASLVGGLATHPAVLVGARFGQGIGGAILLPATLALINTTFDEGAPRNRALAVWGSAGAAGLALGSLLGGVLTDALGWAAVFFVNVPLALVAVVAAGRVIRADGPRDRQRTLDIPGALTATLAMSSLVFGLVEGPERGWTSSTVLPSLCLGLGLLAVFVAIESRSREPLLPLRLFANRHLATAMAITFIFMGTFGTQYYLLTVYLQDVLACSPFATGLAFVPAALLVVVGTKTSEKLLARFGIRPTLFTGMLAGAAGMAFLPFGMAVGGSYLTLVPGIILIGLGQGIIWTAMFAAAATGVAPDEQGIASAMASTSQQIGGAIGLAVLVAVANAGLHDADGTGGNSTALLVDGLRNADWAAAAITAVGAAIAATLTTRHRRPHMTAPDERPARSHQST